MNLPIKVRPGEATRLLERMTLLRRILIADTQEILTHSDVLKVTYCKKMNLTSD